MSKRLKKKHFSWHHRKPRSLGGETNEVNMVHVSTSKHIAWHSLFFNYNPYQIAVIINNVWLDPDYELVVMKKE